MDRLRSEIQRLKTAHSAEVHDLQEIATELKDRLQFTENLLGVARKDRDELMAECTKLQEQLQSVAGPAQEHISALQAELRRVKNQLEEKSQAIQAKENEVLSAQRSARLEKDTLQKALKEQEQVHSKLRESEQKNQVLQNQVEALKQELNLVSMKTDEDRSHLQFQLKDQVASKRDLLEQVEQLHEEIDRLQQHIDRTDTETLQIKNQQLKEDVSRLLRMLSTTSEFRDFAQSVVQHGRYTNSHIAYLPAKSSSISSSGGSAAASQPQTGATRSPATTKSLTQTLNSIAEFSFQNAPNTHRPLSSTLGASAGPHPPINAKKEALSWVPEEAFDTALEFREEHVKTLPFELLKELLQKLNRIWHRREQRKVNTLVQNYERKLEELTRRYTQRNPYKEVVQATEIDYLRHKLKSEQTRKRSKSAPRGSVDRAQGLLLSSSIGMVQKLNEEVSSVKRENQSLRKQQRFIQAGGPEGAFTDGAVWAIRSLSKLTTSLHVKVSDLSQRLTVNSNQLVGDDVVGQNVTRIQSIFVEKLQVLLDRFRDRVSQLGEKLVSETQAPHSPPPARFSAMMKEDL